MTLKLTIDRFEGNIAVCLDGNDKKYEIDRSLLYGLAESNIFTIELDEQGYHSPSKLEEETKAKSSDISNRMKKLFNMSRHTKPPKI